MGLTSDSYTRMLKQLLPAGAAWLLEQGSKLGNLLFGSADELARVGQRAEDVVNESDPRTASETLSDWEHTFGLPDAAIVTVPTSDADRQVAVTQKVTRVGGQTPAYFIGRAASCGYTVTIDDGYAARVLRVGFRVGDRCYGDAWPYAWLITVQAPTGSALSHAELEAILRRDAPAHTTLIFNYL